MKIDYLWIHSPFKNLEGVLVDFDERELMTVIVGRNGSGKSNVVEALVSIFRNLDLGESPLFAYEICFKLGIGADQRWIHINADPNRAGGRAKQYEVNCAKVGESNKVGQWEAVPASKVFRSKKGGSDFLPKYLFSYYSGPSDRLERYFKKHRTDFYRRLLHDQVDLRGDIRPLFYAKPHHSQFVLLAFFLGKGGDKERQFLKDHLNITGLDSVHFVMRMPEWSKEKNELFWGASGVVREFLDLLFPHALAPLKITRLEDVTLTGTGIKNEFFHLFIPNSEALRDFAGNMPPDVFFKMLESTLLSEIISSVRVRVKMSTCDEPLSFDELSEGEQQLLTVLGLLKFTGGQDSLFLLDEPDTHLNPAWAAKYLAFLRDFIPNHHTSHMVMVTHHPLAIAELEKEQVQVMAKDGSNRIYATAPQESPRGMGVNGILTSDMFGMLTTLDGPTQALIRERRNILEQEEFDPKDENRLRELDQEMDALGYSFVHPDEEYRQFLIARKRAMRDLGMDANSKETAESREAIIKQLLKALS